MKATNALPTEERIRRMNDQQWLWYYLNIKKDEEEEDLKWKERLDYLSWFISPDRARSVMEMEKKIKLGKNYVPDNTITNGSGQEIINGDEAVNDSFEEELKRALQESGVDEGELTQLPDSVNVGNPYESSDDFFNRVLATQSLADTLKPNKGDLPPGFDTEEEYLLFLQNLSKEDQENNEKIVDNNDDLDEILKKSNIDIDDIDFIEYPEE